MPIYAEVWGTGPDNVFVVCDTGAELASETHIEALDIEWMNPFDANG